MNVYEMFSTFKVFQHAADILLEAGVVGFEQRLLGLWIDAIASHIYGAGNN